ncbi:hydroxymethylpyrimidine/phosphomethylpyrimidine kinase [Flavobacterium faecale]|uniref:hydroxymethylpyrimidine kinase n=1 Tax=Flavobacterium faecale TaxID=1355330 RepID=A0A2S1L9H3_9FLAO|nr:hydroxymethylpyrimidine/phosphomethylpyrimidine kinase [Flavobacterium faecale]AWG20409.1 hydroxymethylpyrimidine/phosphomethylpyrimidine kinase [Flavobacterium faecale]
MPTNRPFVLSIAGFDPSAGAGVLADIKTFEQHKVYGLSVLTANTIQTESHFSSIQWVAIEQVLESILVLFEKYKIETVKIGIVPSIEYLKAIVDLIKKQSPTTKIVWDTVLTSSTSFNFLAIQDRIALVEILRKIDLITPNYNEILVLGSNAAPINSIINQLTSHCAVLLKGGHNQNELGIDYLHTKDRFFRLSPKIDTIYEKHGSGCVLSAAITANLALGHDLLQSCKKAKDYIEQFLLSNPSLLGNHHA